MDHDRSSYGLLLTVGGGSTPGVKFLKRWINAARAGASDLFPINVVCGPWMDASDRKIIRLEEEVSITIHDWVVNMDELIGSSRGVVCLGGYNTLVEALSLEKPTLAFALDDRGDQAFQINALHSQGMLLKGDESQSESEITALMNELMNFRPKHSIDCNGADRSVEVVKHILDT
jgi:predicted glycosyltransferase